MATIANLNILLNLKDNASGALERSRKSVQSWGQSLQNVGAGLTAGVTAPILGMAVASVRAASDLQESMSAVEQVYGSAANTVVQSSLEAAQAVGLSQQEYLSTAAVLGVYGDTLGFTDQQTADFSDSLITAAADLGSFYNANTPEVLGAMQAALRGEFDPLERFGIMMNQAALEQYALENGISDGSSALTAQQRILAAQGYIMEHMGDATGDFARTSDGLANKQKILKAQLKDVAAKLGQSLLPAVTKAVTMFTKLLEKFEKLSPKWQKWIALIGLAVAAIGPFLLVLGTILTMLPAIGAALAVLTGPIGLVVAAIALLTAAYIGNWWGFRDAVNGVASAAKNVFDRLSEVDAIRTTVESAVGAIAGAFTRITDAIGKVGRALLEGDWRTALAGIGDFLAAPAKAVGDFFKGIETGFEPLDSLLTNVGSMFTDFGRIIQEVFQGDFSGAFDVFKRAIGRIPEIVTGVFNLIPWSDIGTAAKAAFDALPTVLNAVGGILLEKGKELLQGVIDGLKAKIPDVESWLGGVPQRAVDAVGALGETLYAAGADLIGGAMGGAKSMIGFFEAELGAIPQKAVDAVGELGETLYNAGADLIGGLIGGIQSMFGGLQSVLGKVTGWIPDWKGPPEKDAVLLWNNGQLIMGGLIGGIESQVPSLRRSLGAITTDIGGSALSTASRVHVGQSGSQYGGNGGGGFYNYGTYNEADRHWEPTHALSSYSIARSRG